jgi:cytidylate kinase
MKDRNYWLEANATIPPINIVPSTHRACFPRHRRGKDELVQDHVVIAIDGPAASGKSSVAREVARRLGFVYVNSGAMYRAVTWHVLKSGIDPYDRAAVESKISQFRIDCGLLGQQSHIMIDGVDPTAHLREDSVNQNVSAISSVPRVREVLVQKMRSYADDHNVVMEGRDIGSVVFPQTPFKFYIDANPEVRSLRRAAQGEQDAISMRDQFDSSRATAPLIIAPDAEVIDSSHLTIEQVVEKIFERLRAKNLAIGK